MPKLNQRVFYSTMCFIVPWGEISLVLKSAGLGSLTEKYAQDGNHVLNITLQQNKRSQNATFIAHDQRSRAVKCIHQQVVESTDSKVCTIIWVF